MDTFRLLYPEGADEDAGKLHEFDFLKALKLDEMVQPLRNKTQLWKDAVPALERYFTSDERVISYRLAVVEDLLRFPALFDMLEKALPQMESLTQLCGETQPASDTVQNLYSAAEIEMYTELLDTLQQGFANCPDVGSDGMRRLSLLVKEITGGEDYQALKEGVAKIADRVRNIRSVTIGVNLDATLRPTEAGVVQINDKPYRSGDILDRLLRLDTKDDGYRCITPMLAYLRRDSPQNQAAFQQALYNALDVVFKSAVREWHPVIRRYLRMNTGVFTNLTDDIRFLLGAVGYLRGLQNAGLPVCRPSLQPMGARVMELKDVYNPYVGMQLFAKKEKIVPNDFAFDEDGMIYLLTGPNQGGKTVLTYAVGICQALMQLGLFVPAREARISPVDEIYVHFPSQDGMEPGQGRLGEECARMAHILENTTAYSLVLMDETLSSTSAIEATYIAFEIVSTLSMIGCRCLFATHLHDLTQQVAALNEKAAEGVRIDNLVAEIEDKETGVRSFRIVRKKPDGLSYARSIAEKYGVTWEQIMEKRKERGPEQE